MADQPSLFDDMTEEDAAKVVDSGDLMFSGGGDQPEVDTSVAAVNRPLTTSMIALSNADLSRNPAFMAANQNLETVQAALDSGQEYNIRLGIAADRQKRNLRQLDTLRTTMLKENPTPVRDQTVKGIDGAYNTVIQQNLAEDARTALEYETVERVQDLLTAGNPVEAKVTWDLYGKNRGGAQKVMHDEAVKNLILSQRVQELEEETKQEGWGRYLWTLPNMLLPTVYNQQKSGILKDAGIEHDTSLMDWFMVGNNEAKQGQTMWNLPVDEFAKAFAKDGPIMKSLRENSTLDVYDPTVALDTLKNLSYIDDSDKAWANVWGVIDPLTIVPWGKVAKGGSSVVEALTHLGARDSAVERVAQAFDGLGKRGEAQAFKETGIRADEVLNELEPSLINPSKDGASLGVDVSARIDVVREMLNDRMPNLMKTSAFTSEDEVVAAYEAEAKIIRDKYGSAVKDLKYVYEDVASGEIKNFEGRLPQQGNVIFRVEATFGKRDGGGFARASTAAGGMTKMGFKATDDIFEALVPGTARRINPADEGFTIPAFHGTADDFAEFSSEKGGQLTGAPSAKKGFFFTDNPDVAWTYSKNAAADAVIHTPEYKALRAAGDHVGASRMKADAAGVIRPVMLKMNNPLVHDFAQMSGFEEGAFSRIIDEAKAAGNDGVIFKNTNDVMGANPWFDLDPKIAIERTAAFNNHDIYVAFDNANIKGMYDTRVERDVSGQWFGKQSFPVREEGFITSPLDTPTGSLFNYVRSDARLVDPIAQAKALGGSLNAGRISSAITKQLKAALNPVRKVDKVYLDQVIRKGQNEAKWYSPEEFSEGWERLTGTLPSQTVSNAYEEYKLWNDADWMWRNDELYRDLSAKGHVGGEFALGKTGITIDQPMKIDPYPKKQAIGEEVFDASEGIWLDPAKAYDIKMMADNGYVRVSTFDDIRFPDGTVTRSVMIKNSDLKTKALPRQILNYAEGGHREYTGKVFVKQALEDAKGRLRNPAVFITTENVNQGKAWARVMNEARDLVNRGIRDPQQLDDEVFKGLKQFPSGEEFLKAVDDGDISLKHSIEAVYNRELPSAYQGLRDDVLNFVDKDEFEAIGHYRTNGKMYYSKKGQALRDHTGELAETVDPWETLNRALEKITQHVSLSGYKQNMLERFEKTYGTALKGDNNGLFEMVNAAVKEDLPLALQRKVKQEQNAVKRILRFETKFEKGIRANTRALGEFVLGGAEDGVRAKLHDWAHYMGRNDPVGALRSIAFDAKLGLFNFGQFIIQSSTMAASTALNPKYGMKGMMTFSLFPWLKMGAKDNVLDVLSKRGTWKLAGFTSEDEFKGYARFIRDSGFMDVDKTQSLINTYGANRVWGAASKVDGFREAGRVFFYSAEQANRLVASRIAYGELTERGVPFGTSEFRDQFVRLADDYSFNMTHESAAAFQHGIVSIPTQFWAYSFRMMDAMFGPRFTLAQKARLITTQMAIAGSAGLPLLDVLSAAYQENAQQPFDKDSWKATLDRGLLDEAIKQVSGADIRVGEKLGAATLLTGVVKDIFGAGDYGEKSMFDMMAGATGSVTMTALPAVKDLFWYAANETGSDNGKPLTRDTALKIASQVSTFGNLSKAFYLYQYGLYKSNSGQILASDLPPQEAFAVAMGFRPQETADMSVYFNLKENRKQIVDDYSKVVRAWRQEAFSNPDMYAENAEKVNKFLAVLPPSIRAEVRKKTNKITDESVYNGISRSWNEQMMKDRFVDQVTEGNVQ